jgi:alpha-1,3-mannosyltransferase
MRPTQPLRRDLSKVEMLTILFTSNMIGSLFARSLHYQFYSWTAWTLPFLIWRTNWHPLAQIGIWLLEEWAWNVYPSTEASSFSVVAVYALVLFGVWWNWGKELAQSMKQEAEKRQQKELMGKFA